VLPDRFDYVPRYRYASVGSRDFWTPPQYGGTALTWSGRFLQVVGRLAPGATVGQARAEATAVAARLRNAFPDRNSGWGINLLPLHEELVGDVRTTVLTVFGAVLFVLLIACSNVANLLLTRATERHHEMAVRAALGAGRGRLFRQLGAESLVLSSLGGALGLILAWWGIGELVRSAPDLPRLDEITVDARVISFTVLAVVATALLFGLVPALQLKGQELATWLTQRGESGRRQVIRLRSAFVGAQVALSFVLLVGAGLLIRSLINRLRADVGFSVDNLITAEVSLTGVSRGPAENIGRFDQIVDRVASIPAVTAASAASVIPMNGESQGTGYLIEGRPIPPPGQDLPAEVRFVQHNYFRTMGIPLIEGRTLGPEDRADAPIHVVINQTAAKRQWPGESPVGKRIQMEWGDTLHAEIVGVVGDVRLKGPDDVDPGTTIYWDYRQAGQSGRVNLLIRSSAPTDAILPAVRAAVQEIDPNLPLYNVKTMEALRQKTVARARFTTVALGIFAGLALILAALGLYGVMAYATEQRSREIGIRMALGADRLAVVRMVLRQGFAVVGPALILGGIGALLLSRLLRTLVFGVNPADPVTFLLVASLLGASALLACWLPARRASGISPVLAIKAE
jgi:putative ABC transport system permease protein